MIPSAMNYSYVFLMAVQNSSTIVILFLNAIQLTLILNLTIRYLKYVYLITFSLQRSLNFVMYAFGISYSLNFDKLKLFFIL